jgi:hypothetical protein
VKRLISHDLDFKVELNEPWLLVNSKKFGFRMTTDTGEKMIVSHQRKVQTFNKEQGFYVPRPLLKLILLFEVTMKEKCYAQWIYRPDQKQRMLNTPPQVFISLARLEFVKDATHFIRPKEKADA